jgi:hypothetical protein
MEKKYLLYIVLSSCFLSTVGAEKYASYVLSKAQEQFGTKISFEKYKELKERIIYEYKKIGNSNYVNIVNCDLDFNKFYCNSKSGNTLLVYCAYSNVAIGYADIIRLKENLSQLKKEKFFKDFSFPVIATLKVWSKNSGLKIPKPLIDTILQYGYQNYNFDYDGPRETISTTFMQSFPEYHYSSLFVDDQKNFVINFQDEKKNNILYALTKNKNGDLLRLIVPKNVDDRNYLIVNSEICKPGEINIIDIENNSLKVNKNDKPYTIDL